MEPKFDIIEVDDGPKHSAMKGRCRGGRANKKRRCQAVADVKISDRSLNSDLMRKVVANWSGGCGKMEKMAGSGAEILGI